MIKTKFDAELFLNDIQSELTFMDWLTGEKFLIRNDIDTYMIEDAEISEREATKETAVNFVYKHRKQLNNEEIEKIFS